MSKLRAIPSVDQLLQTPVLLECSRSFGRPLTVRAVRETLAAIRASGEDHAGVVDPAQIASRAAGLLNRWLESTLRPVINATGVILHTNLGRAPLSEEAKQAMAQVAGGYSTLEYDLERGRRGSRGIHVEEQLRLLTGAEATLVVNNNAAAVLLILSALAYRKRVVISRSQLVEIGGGFRVPDVMKQSGARLVEVGTTNRVHLSDYEIVLQEPAAMLLWAHHSNFQIVGFTSEPELSELAALAKRNQMWMIDDLGSGALLDTARYGLAHEPTVQEALAAGADLVCFSGDKLLGGPQAGIIVGRADLIRRISRHPLARAVRADKLCLAALTATLAHYLKDEVETKIPVWRMMAETPEQIQARAGRWASTLQIGEVTAGCSTIGGGSLPGETLPTYLLALKVKRPNNFLERLRQNNPAIIARIEEEQVVFDPRTVAESEESALLAGIQRALQ